MMGLRLLPMPKSRFRKFAARYNAAGRLWTAPEPFIDRTLFGGAGGKQTSWLI
jgi:hypothetical protein